LPKVTKLPYRSTACLVTLKNNYRIYTQIDRVISKKLSEIRTLCQEHKVRELYVFGSRGKGGHPTKDSDFDLMVEIDEFDPVDRGRLLLSLYNKFERLFNHKVDLLTASSIKNPISQEYLDTSKQLIYDGSDS
jgi:predicted nucleotidyltransferase